MIMTYSLSECCSMHCIIVTIILMVMIVRRENTITCRREMVAYVVNYMRQTPCPYCTYICEHTRTHVHLRYVRARRFHQFVYYLRYLYVYCATCVLFCNQLFWLLTTNSNTMYCVTIITQLLLQSKQLRCVGVAHDQTSHKTSMLIVQCFLDNLREPSTRYIVVFKW